MPEEAPVMSAVPFEGVLIGVLLMDCGWEKQLVWSRMA
jgi:hypothetical protein